MSAHATPPPELTQRPMRLDDAERWSALQAAVEAADKHGEHVDADDCAEELTMPGRDLDRDTSLVLDGDLAVGYVVLHRREAAQRRLIAEGAVHPAYRGRGVGTALLALAQHRADEADGTLEIQLDERIADAVALAEGVGLTPIRWWFDLGRDLTAPVLPSPLPAELRLVPLGPVFDAPRWDGPLREAHNAAFADHWGSAPVGEQDWAHGQTGSRGFRPGCSAVACDAEGTVAGYLLGHEFEAETALNGYRDLYVEVVGTARPWRGRGVAGALLAHALSAAAAAGYASSSLRVDAHNPTGALGVYERAGYVVRRRDVSYARVG